MQGRRNGFWIGGGGGKRNFARLRRANFCYITLTYRKDTIFFISIFMNSNSLSYQSILSLSIYTYLYLTIFKLLIFLVGKILGWGNCPPPPLPPPPCSITWWLIINPLSCFFGSEGHVALDRNPGSGYNTLLLRMIPGDLLSACPHRQFHTLPGILDSRAALSNPYPNACVPMQGGSLYHFYDGLCYDPTGMQTHDLPCKRRTC